MPALVYGALLIAAVALLAGAPHPGDPAASALTWYRAHTGVLHAAALVIFGAAAPLAIWTATIYRRLRTLGVTAPGAVIGLSGGLLASASLALSGLVTWTLAETAPSVSPALAQVLMDLSFAAGAAGFVVPLALLLAGVAVPSLILRLIPRRSPGPAWPSPRLARCPRSPWLPRPWTPPCPSAGSAAWPGSSRPACCSPRTATSSGRPPGPVLRHDPQTPVRPAHSQR